MEYESTTQWETTSDPDEDWPKTIDWIEKQAQDNIKARFATAELITKEAQTTLALILAALAGATSYALKFFEDKPVTPLEVGAIIVSIYLICVGVFLVAKCLKMEEFPALYQSPKNIWFPNYKLAKIKEAELKNLNERIKNATIINNKRANALNRARYLTIGSACIFCFFTFLAHFILKTQKTSPPKISSFSCEMTISGHDKTGAMKCSQTDKQETK